MQNIDRHNFSQSVDYASPHCEKGYRCGGTCKPLGTTCDRPLLGKAKDYAIEMTQRLAAQLGESEFSGSYIPDYDPSKPATWDDAQRDRLESAVRYVINSVYLDSADRIPKLFPKLDGTGFYGEFVDQRKDRDRRFSFAVTIDSDSASIFYYPIEGVEPSFQYADQDNSDGADTAIDIPTVISTTLLDEFNEALEEMTEVIYREAVAVGDEQKSDREKFEELRSRLNKLFRNMPKVKMGEAIAVGLGSAYLAGRYEVETEFADTIPQYAQQKKAFDFAKGKKAAGGKKKNCTKGWSCGGGCISRNKKCGGALPPDASDLADKFSKQVKAVKKPAKAKGEVKAKSNQKLSQTKSPMKFKGDRSNHKHLEKHGELISVKHLKGYKSPSIDEMSLKVDHEIARDKYLSNSTRETSNEYYKTKRAYETVRDEREKSNLLLFDSLSKAVLEHHGVSIGQASEWASQIKFDRTSGQGLSDIAVGAITRDVIEFHRLTKGEARNHVATIANVENRAFHDPTSKLLNIGDSVDSVDRRAILFHEMGHALEDSDPRLKLAAQGWRKSRASSPNIDQLPGQPLGEIGYHGSYINPYIGRVYPGGATEVISMGVQYFGGSRYMQKLYESDRGHFNFILGVITSGDQD